MDQSPASRGSVIGIDRNVFFLSITSFLQDVSGEMIFTIMPFFLANVLGVGTAVIGLIEGISDSTSTLLKLAGGWLADRSGQRKNLTALGYGLSTAVKPFMYFANAWGIVLAVRFVDRVGKGVRSAPRDALLADCCTVEERGKSFGFHRALDSLGAFVGLAATAAIVFFLQRGDLKLELGTYQVLVLVGLAPGVLGVLSVLFFVKEVKAASRTVQGNPGGAMASRGAFDKQFIIFLGIMLLFTLGNSSDAFLLLRAQNLGLSVLEVTLLLVAFNLVYALVSTPAGIVSDRLGRRGVIALGWSIYALVYLGFAVAADAWQVWLLFIIYGTYYGMTEGVARALVADVVAPERRGTAYGIYNAAIGITALPASIIAGALWQAISPAAPFYFGAGLAGAATVALVALIHR
ncbi:MAG: MFS transporter [Chloroflexi bacterium]|nr:MFS transporter [Chloroflexota bacterium]